MSRIYDNWERLVAAAVKKQQLWELFHQQSRSPSIRSEASDFSPSSSFRSSIHDVAIDYLSHVSSSRLQEAFAKLHPKLVCVSEFIPSFDVEDVFLASSELLGRGTFGSVYTTTMENGVTIVVKRMKPGNITSEVEFKQSMEIVRNVKHENVVPLRAYYCSREERLMLYDHFSHGSVYSLLHGRNDENNRAHVDWETRLRIAIGAARGIDEIHAQNDGKFVHGNIKASNVFINSQQYGCISDLGLASMIATKFLPAALCYAPEIKNKTQNISQESDVYSFGILLLELLTRKSSVYIGGGPHAVDLVKLVTSVKSKVWAAKVFDADLLKNPRIKDKMVKMLQIGISCIAKSPKKRPKMSEVVKLLEDISVNVKGSFPPAQDKIIFIENNKPYFDLDDMLRADVEVLGKGTFGTSYKAVLGNGITIRVKRMSDVNVSSKQFQTEMEVIGRMGHENVGELRAYYYSIDEKLLVYDYHNRSGVSTLLHGKRTHGSNPLDWAARLRIAIGAARGIAYIHKQYGRTFVHGNITATNIFLNEQQYGLIIDAGLVQLTRPIKATPRYCAPEVTNTKTVSQASDVYSFGVVLLELVSGKPPQVTTSNGDVISLVKRIQSVTSDEWAAEVIDPELVGDAWGAMERLLQIGLVCVASAPEHRPKMTQVVKMLDEIGGIYSVEETSVESRLECLLEDLLPTLIL